MHNANLYEYANMLQKRDTANVLREFAPKLKWNTQELILDIGCGSGDVTSGLLVPAIPKNMTKNFNVVGVDVSNDMVDHAKDKYGERNVSFCQMDISHEIPQRKMTRRFSKIFSFYCLHWVKDQGIALHNIHRLLEYNGEAVLVFLAKNPLFQVYRKMARKTEWASYMTVSQSYEKHIRVNSHLENISKNRKILATIPHLRGFYCRGSFKKCEVRKDLRWKRKVNDNICASRRKVKISCRKTSDL